MIYLFQDYSLDVERRELRRRMDLVRVEPQVLDLLQYLIRNRDHVVSKDELIAAVWNGRIIAESALSSRITAVRHAIGDSGEQQCLIRTIARKGFRFVGDIQEQQTEDGASASSPLQTTQRAKPQLVLPDKPSIAVLPFQNLSGDPDQEHFADGTVEEIITALSRFSSLFVIARNSSFIYKGRAADVKQVGRELGVRYVLEGSVRKAGTQVRITSQLIDTSTGAHLWANRFDGSLPDIFDLQDQVALGVVGAVTPKVERAEIDRAKRKPTDSLDAYEYFLRGMASFYQRNREATDEALRLFYAAIGRDAEFASAYGMAAWCYGWRKVNAWTTDRAKEIAETARLARRAAELGPDDAVALSRAAHALATVVGDVEDALIFVDRALALNPNLAGAWWASGWTRVYSGEPEAAIEHFARAMRLSPLDPHLVAMQAGTAFAHMLAGRYDEASSWAEKAMWAQNYLTPLRIAVASHALAGRLTEAKKTLARLLELDPAASIVNFQERAPLRRREDVERLESGLRRAGMPEN
jgi:TolB-like protein